MAGNGVRLDSLQGVSRAVRPRSADSARRSAALGLAKSRTRAISDPIAGSSSSGGSSRGARGLRATVAAARDKSIEIITGTSFRGPGIAYFGELLDFSKPIPHGTGKLFVLNPFALESLRRQQDQPESSYAKLGRDETFKGKLADIGDDSFNIQGEHDCDSILEAFDDTAIAPQLDVGSPCYFYDIFDGTFDNGVFQMGKTSLPVLPGSEGSIELLAESTASVQYPGVSNLRNVPKFYSFVDVVDAKFQTREIPPVDVKSPVFKQQDLRLERLTSDHVIGSREGNLQEKLRYVGAPLKNGRPMNGRRGTLFYDIRDADSHGTDKPKTLIYPQFDDWVKMENPVRSQVYSKEYANPETAPLPDIIEAPSVRGSKFAEALKNWVKDFFRLQTPRQDGVTPVQKKADVKRAIRYLEAGCLNPTNPLFVPDVDVYAEVGRLLVQHMKRESELVKHMKSEKARSFSSMDISAAAATKSGMPTTQDPAAVANWMKIVELHSDFQVVQINGELNEEGKKILDDIMVKLGNNIFGNQEILTGDKFDKIYLLETEDKPVLDLGSDSVVRLETQKLPLAWWWQGRESATTIGNDGTAVLGKRMRMVLPQLLFECHKTISESGPGGLTLANKFMRLFTLEGPLQALVIEFVEK